MKARMIVSCHGKDLLTPFLPRDGRSADVGAVHARGGPGGRPRGRPDPDKNPQTAQSPRKTEKAGWSPRMGIFASLRRHQ